MKRSAPFLVLLLLACTDAAREDSGAWTGPLRTAIEGADRLEVRPTVDLDESRPVLFELSDERALGELVGLIEIDAKRSVGVCACGGQYEIRFLRGGRELAGLRLKHLRSLWWPDGPWEGDACLTNAARKAFILWFETRGFPRFREELDAERERERRIAREEGLFLAAFPKDARRVLRRARRGEKGEAFVEELTEKAGGPEPLAVAICRALGSSSETWFARTWKETAAISAFEQVDGDAFLAALETLSGEPEALAGAARLAFFERHIEKLPEAERDRWAARLAEIVLELCPRAGAKVIVLRRLGGERGAAVRELLRRAATGEFGTTAPTAADDEEPGIVAGALLALGREGDEWARARATELLDGEHAPPDRAALELVLALLGEPERVQAAHFRFRSYSLGFAALEAIERAGGRKGMDALVEGGLAHPWALVANEAVRVFERLTDNDWSSRTSRQACSCSDDVRAWWKAHREEFLKSARDR
jgi:hypothetical protein